LDTQDTTNTQDKQITIGVPEHRLAEFYAFYSRFLAVGSGRRQRGRHGRGGFAGGEPGGEGHPGAEGHRGGGHRGRGRRCGGHGYGPLEAEQAAASTPTTTETGAEPAGS
jgi:hypothetical protein